MISFFSWQYRVLWGRVQYEYCNIVGGLVATIWVQCIQCVYYLPAKCVCVSCCICLTKVWKIALRFENWSFSLNGDNEEENNVEAVKFGLESWLIHVLLFWTFSNILHFYDRLINRWQMKVFWNICHPLVVVVSSAMATILSI